MNKKKKFQVRICYHIKPYEEIKTLYQFELHTLIKQLYQETNIASLTIVKIKP